MVRMARSTVVLVAASLLLFTDSMISEAMYTRRSTPQAWTVEDVSGWARNEGFEEVSGLLQRHGVDGKLLLKLEDHDLQSDLSMHSRLQRKKFLQKVEELRQGYSKPTGRKFWEYREQNRNRCDVTTLVLLGSPRLAFMFWMRREEIGEELFASGVKWIFPHIEIARHHSLVMAGLPGGLLFGHLVMGALEPVIILYAVLLYMSRKRVERRVAKRVLFWQPLYIHGWALFLWSVYPFIPRTVCDLWFYYVMYRCWFYGVEKLMLLYSEDIKDGKIG